MAIRTTRLPTLLGARVSARTNRLRGAVEVRREIPRFRARGRCLGLDSTAVAAPREADEIVIPACYYQGNKGGCLTQTLGVYDPPCINREMFPDWCTRSVLEI